MEATSHNKFELQIKDALRGVVLVPTADCVGDEMLWEFAEQGGSHPEAQRVISHLSTCLFCQQGYSGMVEFQQLASAAQQDAAQTQSRRAWIPTVNFWGRVTEAVAALVEPMYPRQPAFQFAPVDATPELARQPLVFDDANIIGSCVRSGNDYELYIEHSKWPAASLVMLECTTPEGYVRFSEFYVLKSQGRSRSVIETVVTAVDFTGCLLRLRKIDTTQLIDDEAEPLKAAFLSAIETDTDPDVLAAWRQWADYAIQITQYPTMRELSEQIRTWQTST